MARTVVAAIALGAALQGVMLVAAWTGRVQTQQAIRWGLMGTALLYGAVLSMVVKRVQARRQVLRWTDGDPLAGAVVGMVVGAGSALALLVLVRFGTGRPLSDQVVTLIVSEGTVGRVATAVLVVVIAAPLVEELLFRALAVEVLRERGRVVALLGSSLAFALWHLQPGRIVYYTACGFLLGSLYWKRGLIASMAAHAFFNGTLVMAAVVFTAGPAHVVTGNGVSVQVPAAWQQAEVPPGAVGADLVVQGPSGSGLFVGHGPSPGAAEEAVDQLVQAFESGAVPVPGGASMELLPGTTRPIELPAGRAVRLSLTAAGHPGELVLLPRDGSMWVVVLAAEGSDRAERDFEAILRSLRLPS